MLPVESRPDMLGVVFSRGHTSVLGSYFSFSEVWPGAANDLAIKRIVDIMGRTDAVIFMQPDKRTIVDAPPDVREKIKTVIRNRNTKGTNL